MPVINCLLAGMIVRFERSVYQSAVGNNNHKHLGKSRRLHMNTSDFCGAYCMYH